MSAAANRVKRELTEILRERVGPGEIVVERIATKTGAKWRATVIRAGARVKYAEGDTLTDARKFGESLIRTLPAKEKAA